MGFKCSRLVNADGEDGGGVGLPSKAILFPLHLAPGAKLKAYLSLSGKASSTAKLKIWKPVIYADAKRQRMAFKYLALINRGRMAEALKQAIENDEFELYYQPIISLDDGRIRKAEALIRWHHPEEGLLLPDEFIPLAESTGFIVSLTDWVLKQSIRQVTEWRQHLDPHFTISINMPPAYLEACALNPAETRRQLSALSIQAGGIVFEITENAFLTVTPAVQEVLSGYKALGFQIALDDFGVGYSNFGQLNTLSLDFIKIDKSLIKPITTSAQSWALCKTIISVGQTLGLEVIAEGLEDEQQVELIRNAGCHLGQGHVFSKPLPAGELLAFADSSPPI